MGWLLFQVSKSASDHSRPGAPSFTIARFSCGLNLRRQSGTSRPVGDAHVVSAMKSPVRGGQSATDPFRDSPVQRIC